MVLSSLRCLFLAACPAAGLLLPTAAFAEPVSKTAPLVSTNLDDFEPKGLVVGGFRILPEAELALMADDNVYASPQGERSDAVFTLSGGLDARRTSGATQVRALAQSSIRRMASITSENAETVDTEIGVRWRPSENRMFDLAGGWHRLVEDRGDPEALNLLTTGPRLTNLFEARARYRQTGARMMIQADGAVRKYDSLGAINAERDFTSLAGALTAGVAIGAQLYGTATAFVNQRDFRLTVTSAGVDQDATTYGGRLGIETRGTGIVEGRAALGMFRLNPSDPALASRTGFSADVALIFRPQRRTAITLDVSAGDVATFRLGATARNDRRVALTIQQEIRHNLYASAGVSVRESRFIGTGLKERTVSPRLEAEWLINRTLSLVGNVHYQHRTSDDPTERFERFRTGVALRFRF